MVETVGDLHPTSVSRYWLMRLCETRHGRRVRLLVEGVEDRQVQSVFSDLDLLGDGTLDGEEVRACVTAFVSGSAGEGSGGGRGGGAAVAAAVGGELSQAAVVSLLQAYDGSAAASGSANGGIPLAGITGPLVYAANGMGALDIDGFRRLTHDLHELA